MPGPQLIARSVRRLAAKAIGAKQPDLMGLIEHWEQVVGPQWAGRCTPLALRRGRPSQPLVLELAVPPGETLLVQHETPILLSLVNGYFGHGAIASLKIRPTDPLTPAVRRSDKPLVPLAVEGIDDPELAASLGRLGAALRARASKR